MQVIIYKSDDGGVCEVHPSPEVLAQHGLMAIAVKDVPFGKPFKIIDTTELPDNADRNQWDVDEADLTDGVGGISNEFN